MTWPEETWYDSWHISCGLNMWCLGFDANIRGNWIAFIASLWTAWWFLIVVAVNTLQIVIELCRTQWSANKMQGFSEFGRSLSWKNEAILLFLWPQDNPPEFLPQSQSVPCTFLLSPPAAPAWLHPPRLPPPASGIPRSGRWSSWSPAADAVSCCCCCICLWEDRKSQSTSEIQRHTRLLHLSHTLTSHTNTGQNSSYRPNHTLLEWQNNARNNRDLRDAV